MHAQSVTQHFEQKDIKNKQRLITALGSSREIPVIHQSAILMGTLLGTWLLYKPSVETLGAFQGMHAHQ